MATLDDIVNVQITRETNTVDRESFGIPLFAVTALSATNRVTAYSSMDGVAADYAPTTTAYKMALAAFSQEIRPRRIKIGLKTAEETWTQALQAMVNYDNDWYGLATESIDAADIVEIATFVEARTKLYIARSSDADIRTTDDDDVASDLQLAEHDRTAILSHSLAASQYADAAWLGNCLVRDPGSQTWKFKTLNTITPDALTATAKDNALGKSANVYERVAGVNITQDGTVASGEYIDIMRGIDWLTARIKERIFTRMVNSPKIPYTNAGIAVIETAVREQLDIAVAQGLIAPEPPYTVTVPDVLDTDDIDRAHRILRNVNFKARLAGAIHYAEIRGTVSA
ncbi:DUF3383 family protein [Rufibacter sediminis]|uniref:DUF3383 family protein n=1 Tax=Rufibacter sediminis TaxID=2762756 RepID=A0ABR6VTZ5_9BACT|nr:DUF3383 family protein [Rufibacter sediminis]MBC3540658.1 DUF3383 family protein [Rufibacter sediminis]